MDIQSVSDCVTTNAASRDESEAALAATKRLTVGHQTSVMNNSSKSETDADPAAAVANNTSSRNGKDKPPAVGQRRGGRDRKRVRSRSPLDRTAGSTGSRASRRVYVANVAFDVKWSELKDLFRDQIGNVVYCQLFEDEQNRSRGCGLVEFSDPESAAKAIEVLHRFEFRGRELVVKEDLDCERDRYGRLLLPGKGRDKDDGGHMSHNDFDAGHPQQQPLPQQQQQQGFDQALRGGAWNTYGLSPQFLESLGVRGPLNNRIFVANLDYKVGEKKLEEIFKLAGKTLRVRLYTDPSGQSKGHGTVEFEHPVEAVQAISMFHNQKLYGRPMSIRMDKYETEEVAEELPSKLPAGLDSIGKGLGIGGQPLNISKSLLGAAPPITAIAPVPQVAPVPPAMTGISHQVQSLQPSVQTVAMGQLVQQPQVAPTLGLGMGGGGMDQRTSNLTPSLSSNGMGMLSYPSLSTNSAQVRVNPASLGLAPVQNPAASSVYEREFRDPGIGLRSQPVPQSDTVIVRNLPQTVGWQSLRERFSEFGDVRYAELKGNGIAVVRFHTERDAQRAVDIMNGSRIDNRIIELSLY